MGSFVIPRTSSVTWNNYQKLRHYLLIITNLLVNSPKNEMNRTDTDIQCLFTYSHCQKTWNSHSTNFTTVIVSRFLAWLSLWLALFKHIIRFVSTVWILRHLLLGLTKTQKIHSKYFGTSQNINKCSYSFSRNKIGKIHDFKMNKQCKS